MHIECYLITPPMKFIPIMKRYNIGESVVKQPQMQNLRLIEYFDNLIEIRNAPVFSSNFFIHEPPSPFRLIAAILPPRA